MSRARRLTELGPISEEELWTNLEYFLEKVVPVAEKCECQAGDASGRSAALADPRCRPDHAQRRKLSAAARPGAQPDERHHAVPGQFHPDDRRSARQRSATSARRRRSSSCISATCGARREVRGDLARRWQDRPAGLHAGLSRDGLRGRAAAGPRADRRGRGNDHPATRHSDACTRSATFAACARRSTRANLRLSRSFDNWSRRQASYSARAASLSG